MKILSVFSVEVSKSMNVDLFSNERSALNRNLECAGKGSADSGIQFARLVGEILNLIIGLIFVRNASTI